MEWQADYSLIQTQELEDTSVISHLGNYWIPLDKKSPIEIKIGSPIISLEKFEKILPVERLLLQEGNPMSLVFQNIDPPLPSPPGECVPVPPPLLGWGRGGAHTRLAERGMGGQYFGRRETQECPFTVIISLRFYLASKHVGIIKGFSFHAHKGKL